MCSSHKMTVLVFLISVSWCNTSRSLPKSILPPVHKPDIPVSLIPHNENYTLAGFFWGSSFFLFFKNHVSKIKWNEKQEKRICYLGNCTFGIYLIHALIRDILHRIGIDSMMISNTAIAIPLLITMIFVLSLAAVMIIKKIPRVSKWII